MAMGKHFGRHRLIKVQFNWRICQTAAAQSPDFGDVLVPSQVVRHSAAAARLRTAKDATANERTACVTLPLFFFVRLALRRVAGMRFCCLPKMSTLFLAFVAAFGEVATRRYRIDVNERCARLREATVCRSRNGTTGCHCSKVCWTK